jgi:hypothetical protein
MLDRLSELMARKSGVRSGSMEDSVPFQGPSPPDHVEGALRP